LHQVGYWDGVGFIPDRRWWRPDNQLADEEVVASEDLRRIAGEAIKVER